MKYADLTDEELMDLDATGFINFDSLETLDNEVPNEVLNALGRDTVEIEPVVAEPITEEPESNWMLDAAQTVAQTVIPFGEDISKEGIMSTTESLFPRTKKGVEEGRDVVEDINVEEGQLGTLMPGVSNEQLAAVLGDLFSLPGRAASSLVGAVKRAYQGDLSPDEQRDAYFEDLEQVGNTEDQGTLVSILENIIRDPALIPSIVLGSRIGPLGAAPELARKLPITSQLAKAVPHIPRAAQGVTTGIADVAAQDYMNDYAMDQDRIGGLDYAMGGGLGATMPWAIDGAKALNSKIANYMKKKTTPSIPPKFKRPQEMKEGFGVGKEDYQTWDAEPHMTTYAEDMASEKELLEVYPMFKNHKQEMYPGSKEMEDVKFADLLNSDLKGAGKAALLLAEKAEQKMAPSMNKVIPELYNKKVIPVVDWGMDLAEVVNRPLYGTYNFGKKGLLGASKVGASALGKFAESQAYRNPGEAPIMYNTISDLYSQEGEE